MCSDGTIFSERPYLYMGCWKDAPDRAIAGGVRLTGTFEQCKQYALKNGLRIFALENGGECFAAPGAFHTFRKHGKCTGKSGGMGGYWTMDVYMLPPNSEE